MQDNNQASCSENVPLSTENEAEEENEWVLDYLEKIQDALQEEMENIMTDAHDADEEEIWYDALEEINKVDTRVETGSKENLDSKPLYENSPLTVGVSALLIMTFAVRHMITGKALHDLLVLISLHCGLPNYCFKTLYTFKKYFQNLNSP